MVNRRLALSTVFLLASNAYAQAPSNLIAGVPPPQAPPPPPLVFTTTTINETLIFTCPPVPTVYRNVTQYVPVVDLETTTASYFSTATRPVTIYQTVIATTVLTSTATEIVTATATTVSPTTETDVVTATTTTILPTTTTEIDTVTATATTVSPTTATETSITVSPTTATETSFITETSITVSPTTATATEEKFPYTITRQVTSITLCPTRLVNPTYTAAQPYPTEWTWGCPPGWACRPQRFNCNFEAGLPDPNFKCAPNECIPAAAVPNPLPVWGDITANFTPAQLSGLKIQAIDDYFNMNPQDFGLTYEIFVVNEEITLTSTVLHTPTPVQARQAQTSVPGACYPWCNNCLLEAQSRGKTPALCVPGSAFQTDLSQCEKCISVHKGDDQGTFVQVAPQFQQFLDYCDQFSTVVVTTSATATVTKSGGTTSLSVTSTLSTTVTPKSSASAAPPPLPPSSTIAPSGPKTSISTITASTITESIATIRTTAYSESTITGTAWSEITIIMPFGENSTTTLYGADISNNATLVLPMAQTAGYTTTLTGDQSTISTIPPAVPAEGTSFPISGSAPSSALGASTSSISPSTFTGGSVSIVRGLGSDLYWKTVVLGMVLSVVFTVSL